MVTVKIDGKFVEVESGATVLSAARKSGVVIPTLCFGDDGCGEGGSCMICAVKDIATGAMIPACSALALDGMEVITSSEDVERFRRGSLEMLLAEHVGDCVGPCHLTCPAGLEVERILHLCAAERFDEAAELVDDHSCEDCAGACEKACRRGRHDQPVAIKEILKWLRENYPSKTPQTSGDSNYNHRFGKVDDQALSQFLKGVNGGSGQDFSEGVDAEKVKGEAARCLHCDCRAKDDCRLRELAREFGAKQRRFMISQKSEFRRLIAGKTVFEPGKCIKCGRCIAVSNECGSKIAVAFHGRGFEVEVAPPPGFDLSSAVEGIEERLAEVCPTGAFSVLESGR